MTGEITRKSVLIECLQIMREELNICSSKYNGLEPKKGMEEAWEQAREKVKILEDLIHAYDSEPVRRALAGWQQEEIPPKNIAEDFNEHKDADLHSDTEERTVFSRKDFRLAGIEMEPLRI